MSRILFLLGVLILAACSGPDLLEPQREMPVRLYLEPEQVYIARGVPDGVWPDAPITVIVPFLAGGDTDRLARIFAPFLAEQFGWPVNIVNMDGDSGNLGALYVLNTDPDGYTLLFYHTGDVFTNLMNDLPNAVSHTDFAVAAVAVHCDANVLVACASLGFSDAADFLAYIRANPGGLNAATVLDSFGHVLLNMAEAAAGFTVQAVDVGSARLKAGSVLGGHADLTYNNIALFLPYIESGELIPLWVASGERNLMLPDVPTLAELGYPEGLLGRSYFYAFPPGTNTGLIMKWSDAVGRAALNPELRRQLMEIGSGPSFVPNTRIAEYMQAAMNTFMSAVR